MYSLHNPDLVGSSEYRAIYETLADVVGSFNQQDPECKRGEELDALMLACLDEFIAYATEMRETVKANIGLPTCIACEAHLDPGDATTCQNCGADQSYP